MGNNPLLSHLYFCSDCTTFSYWEHLRVGPCACDVPHLHLSISLLSDTKCSRLILYFPCSSLGINPFSRRSSLFPEKAMAPHSSTLAWKIPWTEEPVRLQSMGSLRVGHDWETSLSLFTFMYWRRKQQPTPVLLPGESQGQGSLVGCCLWGYTESDMTEVT